MCTQHNQHLVEMCSPKPAKAKAQEMNAEQELPRHEFGLSPPRPHMLLFFALHFYMLQTYNLWSQMAIFYVITWSLNPFSDWTEIFKTLKVALTKPQDVPFLFKCFGVLYIYWKAFFCYPVETVLWYLDDIVFPEYQSTAIKEPLFLLGQPRSGTTMFETLLSEDDERHCSMLLYEMRYPYLTIQYTVDFLSSLDKRFFEGRGYEFLRDRGMLSCLQETGERKDMRRLRFDLPDEDDLVFFFHTFCHFLLAGFYPREEMVKLNHRFCDLPYTTRMRYMQFHRKTIQKVMFRR